MTQILRQISLTNSLLEKAAFIGCARWCKIDVKQKPLPSAAVSRMSLNNFNDSSQILKQHFFKLVWKSGVRPRLFKKKCGSSTPVWCCLFLLVPSWISVFWLFFLKNYSPQIEVDGPLSAQEQMIILYDIKLQCQQNLSSTDPGFTGKNQKE